jgi:hypothetical protein
MRMSLKELARLPLVVTWLFLVLGGYFYRCFSYAQCKCR